MQGITMLGAPGFLIPLGLLLAATLVWRRRARAAVALAAAAIGGEILSAVLKVVFHRTRPGAFFGLAQPEHYSFPSGHAMVSTCFYGALAAILVASSPRRAPAPTDVVVYRARKLDAPGSARVSKRTLATVESRVRLAYARGSRRKAAYWALGIAPPLLIGFSRVYLGVHYSTDVLAGYLGAIVWLVVLFRLARL
jgi:membrane-associated phospholipid phosphatase